MAKKVTKRAILASLLSLSICTSMLIGTTYAWFTDSVTSSGNIIKSGTLDVAMQWAEGRFAPDAEPDEDPETDDIVWYEAEGDNAKKMFDAEMLWEPGYTAARHIRVSNEGSLALKYNLTILAQGDADDVADLASVIDVYTQTPAVQVSNRDDVSTTLNRVGTLREVLNDTTVLAAATQGHLLAGEKEAILTLALKMQETAGNEYQNKQVNATFDVVLYATQYTEEIDSFDKQYDKLATYESANVGNDLTLVNRDTDAVTQVTVPASAAQVNDIFELSVTNSGVSTDTEGKSTLSLDITLTKNGVALDTPDTDNTEYAVEVYVGKNLNLTAVKHNGTPVTFTYDAATGIVSFTVTSFSPFTVEYNAPKTITFVGGEGTTGTMEAQNVYAGVEAALTANSFEKTGYSFAGWAETAGGAKAYDDGEAITVTESTTLYALWDANPYEVVFNAQGGTGDMANQTINYGASANLTANDYTRTGYDFMGWAATEGGTTVDYADQASYTMNTLGATLYAVWTANDYDVTFNGNGATSGSMQAQTFTFGTSENLTANAFTKTGYSFAGWAESANGEAAYADTQSYTMNTEGATLYAKWAANNYNVTFDGNGATSGSMQAQTFTFGTSENLTANTFNRTGYSFAGWATSANGEAVYADTQSYTMSTEGATLYATWAEIKPTGVTIKKNGTDTTAETIGVGETLTLTAKVAPDTALDTSVAWSTSDADVATVSTNGLVTAKAVGTATITATCNGDNDVTATCTVTVEPSTVDVKYMDYNPSTNTFTEKTQAVPVPNKVTSATTTMSAGWYYVEGTVENANRITVTGTVNLILCDGAQLTASKGITVNSGDTLNIFAQKNGTGELTATGDQYAAGIGGTNGSGGTVTINGGTVTANGGSNAAGIGGGKGGSGGTVTINGGTVTANGGASGAGIGSGRGSNNGQVSGGTVTINGGTVTANGAINAAGIGGGRQADGGNVTINGGTVTANGCENGSGIGRGFGSIGAIGTLTVADGLAVFGGTSANPTTVITNYDTNRPRYMVVKEPVPATGVTLNKTTLALIDGQSQTLQATVSPDEATDKSVTWESNKTSVATVDSNGKVTAVDGGTAVITAKTANGKTASCTVTVEKLAAFDKTKRGEPTTVGQSGNYKNLSYDTALAYAEAKSALTHLECIVVYEITQDYGDKYVCQAVCSNGNSGTIYSSRWDPPYLSQYPEEVFHAFEVDEEFLPNIEVYYAVPTEVTSVTYAPYYLIATPGQSATFSTTAIPASLAGSTTFTYSSSNPNVATVSNNGKITALSAGTTIIKVTTDNGVEASCTLKVQADAPQYANKLVSTTNYTSIKDQVKEISQNEAKELAAYMAFQDQQNATVGYHIYVSDPSFTISVVTSDKEGSDFTWANSMASSGIIKGNFYYVSNS